MFQHILRTFLESSAALSMFKLRSSNKIESQSSNTSTLSFDEKLYSLQYKPMGDIAPLTTSYLGGKLPNVVSVLYFSSTVSTPKLLPTPGGPDTIMALTSPRLVALVMSSRMAKRLRILSITSSSVSSLG